MTALAPPPRHDIDAFDAVLDALPASVQRLTLEHVEGLEEIYLDAHQTLMFNTGRQVEMDYTVTLGDVHYVRDKLDGFKSNQRAGIEGTLHRFSGILDDHELLVGLTVRLGRHVYGVAEPLRQQLLEDGSLMVVGPPGVGKTTLLRDIVRVLAEKYKRKCVAVDTSNEIGGDGTKPHPAVRKARRMKVGRPERQREVLFQAVRNHGPEVVVVDELGYQGDDVEEIEKTSRLGVRVVATLHGHRLRDVLNNPAFWPLLGHPVLSESRRVADPVFRAAVEVRGKGKYLLHANLEEAVDRLLQGQDPGGEALGPGWEER